MPGFNDDFSDELAELCADFSDRASVSGSERPESGGRSSRFELMLESRLAAGSAAAFDEPKAAAPAAVDGPVVETSGAIDMAAADEVHLSPRHTFFLAEPDTDELKGYVSGVKRRCRNGETENDPENGRDKIQAIGS